MPPISQKLSDFSQEYAIPRERMIARLKDYYGIRDERVLTAMRTVPRHFFVPEALRGRAYGDHALPISANQTISQPFIVARMTELIDDREKGWAVGSRARSHMRSRFGYRSIALNYIDRVNAIRNGKR